MIIHHNRRADRERRNSENCADHPLGTRILGIEAEKSTVFIRDALEGAKNELRLKSHIGLKDVRLAVLVATLQRSGLSYRAEDLREGTSLAVRTLRSRKGANRTKDVCSCITNILEPSCTLRLDCTQRLFCEERLGAVEADDVCKLLYRLKELIEIDGTRQSNVTKVARTVLIRLLASGTLTTILNHTEARIKHAIGNRNAALVCLVCGDLHNRALKNVVGVRKSELNANDSVTHD